jgi:hypothetical protein
MNRIALIFAFCLGFGSLCVGSAAAQNAPQPLLPRAQAGQPVVVQTLVPAQPPISAQPPGFIRSASPSVTPIPRPQAGVKTSALNQPARPIAPGTNGTVKSPEQMKVVGIYRGEGYFDAGLAEKLRPMLAKAFGVTPASNGLAPTDLLRSILRHNEGSETGTDQNTVAKTGQP